MCSLLMKEFFQNLIWITLCRTLLFSFFRWISNFALTWHDCYKAVLLLQKGICKRKLAVYFVFAVHVSHFLFLSCYFTMEILLTNYLYVVHIKKYISILSLQFTKGESYTAYSCLLPLTTKSFQTGNKLFHLEADPF